MFRFRHLPVADPAVTNDLEQLQVVLAETEAKFAAAENRIRVLEARREDSGWILVGGAGNPAFEHVWKNLGGAFLTAAYRKQGNIVRLRGTVNSGEAGKSAFTLPAGFRPAAETLNASGGGAGPVNILISAAGLVKPSKSEECGLDSITFTVD